VASLPTASDRQPSTGHSAPLQHATPEASREPHSAFSRNDAAPVDAAPFLPDGCPNAEPGFAAWRPVDPVSLSSDEGLSLNRSACEWTVTLEGGLVTASQFAKVQPKTPPSFRLPLQWGAPHRIERRPAGILVGFDRGEWGGALLWYSSAGALQGTLLHENVVEILPGVASSVAFVGLAHLGEDSGRAVEILEDATRFRVGRSVDLKSAPRAVVREQAGTILVVTHRGLVRLAPDFTAKTLLDTHWGLLYPNAAAVDAAGIVYVGMRGVVARLAPQAGGYREEWLFPPTGK